MKKLSALFLLPLFFLFFNFSHPVKKAFATCQDYPEIPISLALVGANGEQKSTPPSSITTAEKVDLIIHWKDTNPDDFNSPLLSMRAGLFDSSGNQIPSSLDGFQQNSNDIKSRGRNDQTVAIENIILNADSTNVSVRLYQENNTSCNFEQNSPSFKVSKPSTTASSPGARIVSPKPEEIDASTDKVRVEFNVTDNPLQDDYYLCLKQLCSPDDLHSINKYYGDDKPLVTKASQMQIDFCGDGESDVKPSNPADNSACDPQNDFFHEQSTYFVSLYANNKTTFIEGVTFYIKHYYPHVSVSSSGGNTWKPGSTINVSISQDKILAGGDSRNNYQVTLRSTNGSFNNTVCDDDAATVKETNKAIKITFPMLDWQTKKIPSLPAGDYILEVNEANNERFNSCAGGFSYYYYDITLDPNGGKMTERKDPNNSEIDQEVIPSPPPLPCIEGVDKNGTTIKVSGDNQVRMGEIVNCTKVSTALGVLDVTPQEVIRSLFVWLLGIAGVSAFSLFLYAGYTLMMSSGNKEKVQGAREIITSAIVGLLFIIFSVAILEFIGVDVLRLPGLGK